MTLKSWLQSQPFSLALSSGFFGFFAHCGFVKALYEEGCIPTRLAGASAGAIIAGGLASGLQPADLEKLLLGIEKKDFWDPGLGVGLLKGEMLETSLATHFVKDFSEVRIPLHVSVFDIFGWRTRSLEEGSLLKAVRASCTVPFLFHPTRIQNRFYWDGGVQDKMAVAGLNREDPVLCHYLQSQGIFGSFETPQKGRLAHRRLKTVWLENLTSSGPDRLGLGQKIIGEAYEQTLRKLQEPIEAFSGEPPR